MRKKKPCNVIVHVADSQNCDKLADEVSDFYVQVVKRKLSESDLATEDKITVIDRVIESLKIT